MAKNTAGWGANSASHPMDNRVNEFSKAGSKAVPQGPRGEILCFVPNSTESSKHIG